MLQDENARYSTNLIESATNSNIISKQPIIGFDWHSIKFGLSCLVAFDRTVKICTINKLNLIR